MTTRFMSLKGQPIHRGHCYLIRKVIEEAIREDKVVIAIVNPYPLEKMDLSRNRKPENFSPERNPLSYFERCLLLRRFLTSIALEYSHIDVNQIIVVPYFVPTVFELEQTHNYLDISKDAVEYISSKDEFELGKEAELNSIGVRVRFVSSLKDENGVSYGTSEIREGIQKGENVSRYFDPIIYKAMEQLLLFDAMRRRIRSRRQGSASDRGEGE